MGIMFGMFLLHFGYLGTQNVKQLFFTKFGPACAHTRSLEYLDIPILLRAHVQCMHVCVICAEHDVTTVHI